MKELIIDRQTWANGRVPSMPSQLLDIFNRKCCLGFLATASGFTDKEILCKGMPDEVVGKGTAQFKSVLFAYSFAHSNIAFKYKNLCKTQNLRWQLVFAILNDARDVEDSVREEWIAEGFKNILEYNVKFIGEYPNAF